MEIARDPFSMAYLGLIYAKKRRRKSHAWAPLTSVTKSLIEIFQFLTP
jgi:hypothetical protein